MNKKFLMLTCATMLTLGANGAWCADGTTEALPEPAPANQEMRIHKGNNHKMRAEKLANELGLSEEQRKKAEDIRKADFEKMKPLMEEMKALREKMDALRQENMKEFESILTPEQQEKFKGIMEEHKRKMDERKQRHHGKRPGFGHRPAAETFDK